MNIRENWRIFLLIGFIVMSGVALFAPTGGSASAASEVAPIDDGPTNLKYGLELSGGTRITAPLVGLTVENVQFNTNNSAELEREIANRLNVAPIDVEVRVQSPNGGSVEVFNSNVSKQEFAQALQAAGLSVQPSDIRRGVTDETRQIAVNVLDKKIKGAGLSGGDAAIVTSATGESYILVEVPNQTPKEVTALIDQRGTVQIIAHFPVQKNGTTVYRNVPLLSQAEGDFAGIQPAAQGPNGAYVQITLTKEAARNFSHAMRTFGFTSPQGIQNCHYRTRPNDSGYCLYTVVNGKVVNGEIVRGKIVSAATMAGLAQLINSHEFVKDPTFIITTGNLSEAQRLRLNLQAGALPADLAIDRGTSTFIRPSLAAKFKTYALITGLVAMVAVAGVVSARYREPRVAIPMILTAGAEVFILLGFAAAVGLALDLSHIAGFIAVVGTGVDDLVIIADEILQQGDVKTGRVFRSRFRKAFWAIGAAAATTIVAMSPLAVLSLGDLQGFAIVTIVGVLIGVLITRPAYGDVLRNLILE